jgi:hypothetical protein
LAQQPAQPVPPAQPQVEAKGKTVFEEVGDWLANNFKALKNKIIKIGLALIFAVILFAALDIFMQITPIGKNVYSRINPPDVVIVTVPAGATVSMKARDSGENIIQNASSAQPISLRKVQPQTYIVTALKEGFKPVQRVIRVEERSGKSTKAKQEKIEIMFDFMLDVNSEPQGADVYIDGNKFGVTPCKVQLVAGEHTVRLSLVGYEDLGSKAKEAKEGQCNIDFSRSSTDDMFGGVDKNYWKTELKKIDGENVFSIKGHMYKKFSFKSSPSGMVVHIDGESRPRGNTPLAVNIKNGNYKVRVMDPEGRYGQTEKEISINATSPAELSIQMDKIIRFSVRSKDKASESFTANLSIKSAGYNTSRSIGTGKNISAALPTGSKYTFTFTAPNFKPFVISNADISEATAFAGVMEYENVPLNLKVSWLDRNGVSTPLVSYVYIDNTIVGKTDKNGSWTGKYYPKTLKGKIIAENFIMQEFEATLQPGKPVTREIVMIPEVIPEPDIPENPFGFDGSSEEFADIPKLADEALEKISKADAVSTLEAIEREYLKKGGVLDKLSKLVSKASSESQKIYKPQIRKVENSIEKAIKEKKKTLGGSSSKAKANVEVVECPYCGYLNQIPAGRKL